MIKMTKNSIKIKNWSDYINQRDYINQHLYRYNDKLLIIFIIIIIHYNILIKTL